MIREYIIIYKKVICLKLQDIRLDAEIGLDGDTQAQQESVLNVTIYFELGF